LPENRSRPPFIQRKIGKKRRPAETLKRPIRLKQSMKKSLFLSAVLLGAVSASRAGVNVSIGIGLPLPAPVIIGPPAPLPACAPVAPVVVVPPPVLFVPGPSCYVYRHGYFPHREWERFRGRR